MKEERMMKSVCLELTRVSNSMGSGWFARWVDYNLRRYEMQYLGYSKKEVIWILRNRENCSISRDVIKYGYEL